MRRTALLLAASVLLSPAAALAQAAAPDGARVTIPESELPDPSNVDPQRFSERPADLAYGAYQRGFYLTARNLALPLAEEGDPAAQTLLGEIYSRGLGVRQDPAQALKWYEMAAEQDVPEAMFQLGMILLDGGEAFGDPDRARAVMREAADAGHRIAQFNFAQMLLAGSRASDAMEEIPLSDDADSADAGDDAASEDTVTEPEIARSTRDDDVALAVSYYERAAEAGLPDAQYAMAQVLFHGVGGKGPDEEEARRWLEQAANQGYDTAQIELGSWLVEQGGIANQEAGFGWLMRAATAGNPAAQNRVAKLYRAGIGVEPDRVQAAMWYLRARRAGLIDLVMEDQLAGLTDEEMALATFDSNRL